MEQGKNNLDDHIKKALESLEEAAHQPDWAAFEAQLADAEQVEADAMDDAMFDQIMLAGLSGLEVDFDPESWDKLAEKLTTEQILEDTEIDSLAHQSLHNYEVPYQKSHWEIMAERLEEEFSLRRKLYRYKVLELSLMLLFLITLINYLPFDVHQLDHFKGFKFEIFHNNKENTPVASNIVNDQTKKEATKNTIKQAPVTNQSDEPVMEVPVADAKIPFNNWKNTTAGNEQRVVENIPAKMPFSQKELVPVHSDNIYIGAKKGRSQNALLAQEQAAQSPDQVMQSILNSLDLPKAELLDFNSVLPSIILVPNKEKSSLRFSMLGNYEANYVFSPDNEELGSSRDTTLGWGYGGGMLGGFKRGKWGFETGVIYNHKSYPPNFINQFNPDGNKNLLESEYFQDIQLEILQIPVHAQYFMVNQPKWRVYASSGVSLNLLLTPIYQISETRAALVTTPPPSAPPGGEPDKSLKNKTEFPQGILHGDGLKGNSYLTANFGIGIERSVGSRWSVFAQPNYQHYLSKNGLRPFKDKFYTFSLSVGTRVTIK